LAEHTNLPTEKFTSKTKKKNSKLPLPGNLKKETEQIKQQSSSLSKLISTTETALIESGVKALFVDIPREQPRTVPQESLVKNHIMKIGNLVSSVPSNTISLKKDSGLRHAENNQGLFEQGRGNIQDGEPNVHTLHSSKEVQQINPFSKGSDPRNTLTGILEKHMPVSPRIVTVPDLRSPSKSFAYVFTKLGEGDRSTSFSYNLTDSQLTSFDFDAKSPRATPFPSAVERATMSKINGPATNAVQVNDKGDSDLFNPIEQSNEEAKLNPNSNGNLLEGGPLNNVNSFEAFEILDHKPEETSFLNIDIPRQSSPDIGPASGLHEQNQLEDKGSTPTVPGLEGPHEADNLLDGVDTSVNVSKANLADPGSVNSNLGLSFNESFEDSNENDKTLHQQHILEMGNILSKNVSAETFSSEKIIKGAVVPDFKISSHMSDIAHIVPVEEADKKTLVNKNTSLQRINGPVKANRKRLKSSVIVLPDETLLTQNKTRNSLLAQSIISTLPPLRGTIDPSFLQQAPPVGLEGFPILGHPVEENHFPFPNHSASHISGVGKGETIFLQEESKEDTCSSCSFSNDTDKLIIINAEEDQRKSPVTQQKEFNALEDSTAPPLVLHLQEPKNRHPKVISNIQNTQQTLDVPDVDIMAKIRKLKEEVELTKLKLNETKNLEGIRKRRIKGKKKLDRPTESLNSKSEQEVSLPLIIEETKGNESRGTMISNNGRERLPAMMSDKLDIAKVMVISEPTINLSKKMTKGQFLDDQNTEKPFHTSEHGDDFLLGQQDDSLQPKVGQLLGKHTEPDQENLQKDVMVTQVDLARVRKTDDVTISPEPVTAATRTPKTVSVNRLKSGEKRQQESELNHSTESFQMPEQTKRRKPNNSSLRARQKPVLPDDAQPQDTNSQPKLLTTQSQRPNFKLNTDRGSPQTIGEAADQTEKLVTDDVSGKQKKTSDSQNLDKKASSRDSSMEASLNELPSEAVISIPVKKNITSIRKEEDRAQEISGKSQLAGSLLELQLKRVKELTRRLHSNQTIGKCQ
jgi:hypothetical protein